MRNILFVFLFVQKVFALVLHSMLNSKNRFHRFVKKKIEIFMFFAPRRGKRYPVIKELKCNIAPVRFLNSENIKLYAWYIPAQQGKKTVIYCHGQSESILKWQNVALFLKNEGYGVFLLSFRGHYKSAGFPTERGICNDIEAAAAYLEKQGVETSELVLWGRSIGASAAISAACKLKTSALIVESAFDNIKNAGVSVGEFVFNRYNMPFLFPFFKSILKRIDFLQKFDNINNIKNISCPTLIMHSKTDRKISYAASQNLKEANQNSTLHLFEEGSHDRNDWCLDKAKEFLSKL